MADKFKYVCEMCGEDIRDGEVYPQGEGKHRVYLHRLCNKYWPAYMADVSIASRELDERRAAIREKCKEKYRKMILKGESTPGPAKDASGKVVGAEAVFQMQAELSAGGKFAGTEAGVTGTSGEELETDLAEIARKKSK
jgi:hypothetical protein